MKKPIHSEDSLPHICASITSFNGPNSIKNFESDEMFLQAWLAGQRGKKKFNTVKGFERLMSDNPNSLRPLTHKLRADANRYKAGEKKAYSYFQKNHGLFRDEINEKLGIES